MVQAGWNVDQVIHDTSVDPATFMINIDPINVDESTPLAHDLCTSERAQRANQHHGAQRSRAHHHELEHVHNGKGAPVSTYVGATEAARLLGVTKPTLYAYVSRGIVTRRTAADGRTSLYDRGEIERLIERTRRRAASERPTIDVAIASAVTELGDDGVRYRGHTTAELARSATFEQVAELLWSGTLPDHTVV